MSREKANHEQQCLEAAAKLSHICSCIQVLGPMHLTMLFIELSNDSKKGKTLEPPCPFRSSKPTKAFLEAARHTLGHRSCRVGIKAVQEDRHMPRYDLGFGNPPVMN